MQGLPGLLDTLGHVETQPLQLPGLLKSSASVSRRFLQYLDAFPQLAEPVVQVYGKDIVKTAIETAKTANSVCPTEPKRKKKKRNNCCSKSPSVFSR